MEYVNYGALLGILYFASFIMVWYGAATVVLGMKNGDMTNILKGLIFVLIALVIIAGVRSEIGWTQPVLPLIFGN